MNKKQIIIVAAFDTRSYMFYMIDGESLMVSHIAKNINIFAIKATELGFIVTESRVSNVVMILMASFLLFGEI